MAGCLRPQPSAPVAVFIIISVMNSNTMRSTMQATAAELGPNHPLPLYISEENALHALSTAHSGSQTEFDFVMAYICTNPGALNPPGGMFTIFCYDKELVRRCLHWMITKLASSTDDDDESGDMI